MGHTRSARMGGMLCTPSVKGASAMLAGSYRMMSVYCSAPPLKCFCSLLGTYLSMSGFVTNLYTSTSPSSQPSTMSRPPRFALQIIF